MFKRRRLNLPTITQQTRANSSLSLRPSIKQAHQAIRDLDSGEGGVHAFVWTNNEPHPTPSPSSTSPLATLPIAVKDTFVTGPTIPTTAASKLLHDFRPPYASTATTLLSNAGAYLIGKTSCDEFGMGSHNVHLPESVSSPPTNPFVPAGTEGAIWRDRERRSCGGSSGGSAAAVAAGMAWAALGTDTGGSTRLPASYCGIVGLKPSYGLISRHGLISYADTLDTVGVMAKEVSAVERVFDVLSQPDAQDPTCVSPDVRETAQKITRECLSRLPNLKSGRLDGLRIGVPIESFPSELSPQSLPSLSRTLSLLQDLGATLHSVSTPLAKHALSAYYIIASAEACSNLARFDGARYGFRADASKDGAKELTAWERTRGEGMGAEVKKRVLVGSYALSAEAYNSYYLPSLRLRQSLTQSYLSLFRHPSALAPSTTPPCLEGVDLLLTTSAIRSAPLLESVTKTDKDASGQMDEYVQDILTVPASLTGLPAMSLPAGVGEDGWPVGVGMVGFWGGEGVLFEVGKCLESEMAARKVAADNGM